MTETIEASEGVTLAEAVAKMRDVLDRLPGKPWERSSLCKDGENEPKTIDEACELMSKCLRFNPENPVVRGVFSSDVDSWICHTGNGPSAELTAEFISLARNWMPGFLNALESRLNKAGEEEFNAIAKLCGCEHWEYPGQVVRDVEILANRVRELELKGTRLHTSVADHLSDTGECEDVVYHSGEPSLCQTDGCTYCALTSVCQEQKGVYNAR